MPETGSGTPRDKYNVFYVFFRGVQNILFYRICEADPLTAFGLFFFYRICEADPLTAFGLGIWTNLVFQNLVFYILVF